MIGQLPIKAVWIDAPLALRDFSGNNKYNISLLFLISSRQDRVNRLSKS